MPLGSCRSNYFCSHSSLRVWLPSQNPPHDAPWIMLPQLMSSCHSKGASPLEMCCLWGKKHKGITPLTEVEIFYLPPRGRRYFVIALPLPPNYNRNLRLRTSLNPFPPIFLSFPKKPPTEVCIKSFSENKGEQLLTQFTLIIMSTTLDMSNTEQASRELGSQIRCHQRPGSLKQTRTMAHDKK